MSLKFRFIFAVLLMNSTAFSVDARRLSVVNGNIEFVVVTNVLSMTVEGQSSKMTADVTLDSSGSELNLRDIRAVVDPKTLATGISLRDRHMREKVFAIDDGTVPQVQFTGKETTCPKPQSNKETTCQVSGQLTIRRATRPFAVDLKIRDGGNGYRINGNGVLMLSAFGIERPCQLGVCVNDEVKLTFTFQVKDSQSSAGAR